MSFDEEIKEKINLINEKMHEYLQAKHPEKLFEAMNYSVFPGGKRIRPLLLLCVCDFFGDDIKNALPFACALEMIHTYSLIHDDLPAMDDDDYRRGKLTSHKVFGEAMAILAGDALLNQAYEIMANHCQENFDIKNIKAMSVIAKSAGALGMIGGQVVDIEYENKIADESTLIYIHRNKTGKLFEAAMASGAYIGGANEKQIGKFAEIGQKLGIVFQIKDDILDVSSNFEKLGKSTHSDEKNSKTTYVSLYGLEKAEEDYSRLSSEIIGLIKSLYNGESAEDSLLLKIVEQMLARES